MILVTSLKRLARCVVSAVLEESLLCKSVAYADEPYMGYNYDWWGDPVPSQNGYIVDRVYSGDDLGVGSLTQPSDMFFSDSGELYIVDTGFIGNYDSSTQKGRIVITSEDFATDKVKTVETLDFSDADVYINKKKQELSSGEITQQQYDKETSVFFRGPTGIFVDEDDMIYVADNENNRVVVFTYEEQNGKGVGKVITAYTRPPANVYDSSTTFNPSKVLVDAAKNVYICIQSITSGAVVFSKEGDFSGFFGANRVEQTGEVIINAIWKLIFTREQIKRMKRAVPVEISNFDIDDDNFVYTVTEAKNAQTDILKKLNSAGTNVFTNLGYSEYDFGDPIQIYYRGTTYSSQITDVEIGDEGMINLLDLRTGRVFQYDDECNLLFIFGGIGAQKGTFTTVNAIESRGTNIYVLDGRKCSVTVFKQTEFGSIVHEATRLFNSGKYDEAIGPWEEVLRRDSNYWLAYIGLGNACLNKGEYEQAMEYFYYNSKGGYNDAFKGWRMNFIRDNFTLFAVIIIVLLAGIYILSSISTRKKAKKRAAADALLREQQKKEE